MHNRYFLGTSDDPNIDDILNICIGTINTIRIAVTSNKVMVKLHLGNTHTYAVLSTFTELNNADAYTETLKDEWQYQEDP